MSNVPSKDVNIWPDRLHIRDTQLHDDLGGGGQRIYTTAGRGYEKREYVRADLTGPGNPTQAVVDAATKPLHVEIERLKQQRSELIDATSGEIEQLRTALVQVTAAYDKLLKRMGAVREAVGTEPHFEGSGEIERLRETVKSLCDRLERINCIVFNGDIPARQLNQIADESGGFAQLPPETSGELK